MNDWRQQQRYYDNFGKLGLIRLIEKTYSFFSVIGNIKVRRYFESMNFFFLIHSKWIYLWLKAFSLDGNFFLAMSNVIQTRLNIKNNDDKEIFIQSKTKWSIDIGHQPKEIKVDVCSKKKSKPFFHDLFIKIDTRWQLCHSLIKTISKKNPVHNPSSACCY